MNNSSQVCGGRQGCTSEVTHACNCGNPVVFLCTSCIVTHLSEQVIHTFISIEQAKELVKDTQINESFHTNLAKYTVLKASISNYIGCLETYKENLIKTRHEIMSLIEQEFQAKLEYLTAKKTNAVYQLENIMRKMKGLTSGYDEILSIYDDKGIQGLLDDYIPSFEIKTDPIEDAIRKMFRESDTELIYYCTGNSSQLRTYDIHRNSIQTIELVDTIRNKFYNSSTCLLPDGNVMIVGGNKPTHGDTYRFNPKTGQCSKLNPLNNPRGYVNLICHNEYLYAFGGYTGSVSNKSERMKWLGNGWTNLPNMEQPRDCPGIISMDERIYFIGGKSTSVEYYDILNNTFNLASNVQVDDSYNLAVMRNDKIYTINQSKLKIMSKNFKILEAKDLSCNQDIYVINSCIIEGKNVYFRNSKTGFICLFDIANNSVTELIQGN
jgi:hypothetical protein